MRKRVDDGYANVEVIVMLDVSANMLVIPGNVCE